MRALPELFLPNDTFIDEELPFAFAILKTFQINSDIPVFALGGVAPVDLEQAQKHNAYGLAGIRQFSSI